MKEKATQLNKDIDLSTANVQAFINNISVPKTLEELTWFISENGCFNVENILSESFTTWTAPRWAKPGDIVFFMHAKCANSYLTALRTKLKNCKQEYSNDEYDTLLTWINRGLALHKLYGGKIFAIGQVCGNPEAIYYDDEENIKLHWSSPIYVNINNIFLLERPIDISEFNEFIKISKQSGITPVLGDEYDQLKFLIEKNNIIPDYFLKSTATPLPLTKISQDNWMSLSNEYRRAFILEMQFRTFYVNYLLREISDIKSIYKECRCKKKGIPDSFVDNVIKFLGKYLPVEIKLSIFCQSDIKLQVKKYCYDDEIIIDTKKDIIISGNQIIQNQVFIIDTENIYLYNDDCNRIEKIFDLDNLNCKLDVEMFKDILKNKLV